MSGHPSEPRDRNLTLYGDLYDVLRRQPVVSEHPIVDGNKRTALNTVVVFYDLNGYEFEYQDESIRTILNRIASDAEAVDIGT